MDQEMEAFKADLLQSIKEMKAGEWARTTMFKMDGGNVRRITVERAPAKPKSGEDAGAALPGV